MPPTPTNVGRVIFSSRAAAIVNAASRPSNETRVALSSRSRRHDCATLILLCSPAGTGARSHSRRGISRRCAGVLECLRVLGAFTQSPGRPYPTVSRITASRVRDSGRRDWKRLGRRLAVASSRLRGPLVGSKSLLRSAVRAHCPDGWARLVSLRSSNSRKSSLSTTLVHHPREADHRWDVLA